MIKQEFKIKDIPVMFKGAVAQRKGFETLWGIFKNLSLRAVRMINEGARLGIEFPRIPIVVQRQFKSV